MKRPTEFRHLLFTHLAEVARVLRPGGDFVIMNYSYRWDRALDVNEVRSHAERSRLAIIQEGITLWYPSALDHP